MQFGLTPSEVRGMTVGEIYAIADYKIRQGKPRSADEELYEMLMEARNNG